MQNWWKSLSVSTKLNIPLQVVLVLALSCAHFWVMEHIEQEILDGAKRRSTVLGDGIINGMNMLMITGMISSEDNRRLFISKMSDSDHIKELRIIRAKQVQDQFGPGLPEEQIVDDVDGRVIQSRRSEFHLSTDQNSPTLRAVVPFIASTNYRGTNCLSCHHVADGSVNGAASITIDLKDDFNAIRNTQYELWAGQFLLQILLFYATHWLIRRFMRPIITLQAAMDVAQRAASMSQFRALKVDQHHCDEVGKLTWAFNQMAYTLGNSENSMKLAAAIYHANADAIVVTDEHNQIVDVNPAFTRITGYTLEEVIGKNPRLMQSGRHDAHFYREMWQEILNKGQWQGELWDRRKDGNLYAKEAHILVLRHQDGSIFRHVAQFSDITEKKQKDELIHWQANFDPLTNLPNRRLFHDRLGQAIKVSQRSHLPLALFFIDLDHFKAINDNLGHANGDALLMEVARRIKRVIRDSDTVSRLGGDEFTVILPELHDPAESLRAAKDILEQLAQPFYFVNHEAGHHISASIGIALYPQDASEMAALLKCADKAMYAAKGEGRNRYVHYNKNN
jgi:diguanylate cyclase (GGDEF)-like protein/PAS domain S-box-containing protein